MTETLTVGDKIRYLRKRLKLTQSELAGTDFTKSFISQIEKGQTNPSLKSLNTMAKRLGMPVSYFLADESPSKSSRDYIMYLENARHCENEDRLVEALEYYAQALSNCSSEDHAVVGFIHLARGEIQYEQAVCDGAIRELELAIEHLQFSHDIYNLARAYILLGHLYTESKRYYDAVNIFKTGLMTLEHSDWGNRYLKLRLLVNIGIAYSHIGKYEQSIITLNEALELMKVDDSFYNFGKVCHTLGYAHASLGRLDMAIEYTTKAVNLYKGIEHPDLLGSAQVNLAIFLRQAGRESEAESILSQVIKSAGTTQAAQIARAHAELSHLALDDNNSKKAIEQIQVALQLAPLHEDVPEWVALLVKCSEKEALPKGVILAAESLASRWRGEPRSLAEIHSNLGELYKRLGDTTKANEHLSRSVALYAASR